MPRSRSSRSIAAPLHTLLDANFGQLKGTSKYMNPVTLDDLTFLNARVAKRLEHDPEKWKPVFGKDHAPTQYLNCDPIQLDRITV